MKNGLLIVFFVLSALHLFAIAAGIDVLRYYSKPVLMPLLMALLYHSSGNRNSPLRFWWQTGLGFSTLGDILLMFSGSTFFLAGLASFLLAHLSYIRGMQTTLSERRGFLLKNPLWIIPFALFPVLLLVWLWADIPAGMRAPVAIYAMIISAMALSVVHLRTFISDAVFASMLGGALLFMLSDSLIAINQFGHAHSYAPLFIMVTYLAGQFLLVNGVKNLLIEA